MNTNGSPPTWNLANQITVARFVAAAGMFVAIHCKLYTPALVLFIVGAGSDWLDGYVARKYHLITQLGRIMDPLADKIIICGAFIFLAAIPDSGVPAWIAVVVVIRELVVTVIRSFLEQSGHDFSAKMPGKIKMVLQCAVVIASLWVLQSATPTATATTVVYWLAIAMTISTIWSALLYMIAAAKLLGDDSPGNVSG